MVEVYGIHISLGLLSKIEKQVTKQMEEPYQEAARETQSAPVVYADETSWSSGGIPGWLWIATTGHVARFLIDDGRGSKAAGKRSHPETLFSRHQRRATARRSTWS